MNKESTVTVQRTHKRYKAAGCIGGLLFAVGLIPAVGAAVAYSSTGEVHAKAAVPAAVMIGAGLLLRIYAAVGKWWNND